MNIINPPHLEPPTMRPKRENFSNITISTKKLSWSKLSEKEKNVQIFNSEIIPSQKQVFEKNKFMNPKFNFSCNDLARGELFRSVSNRCLLNTEGNKNIKKMEKKHGISLKNIKCLTPNEKYDKSNKNYCLSLENNKILKSENNSFKLEDTGKKFNFVPSQNSNKFINNFLNLDKAKQVKRNRPKGSENRTFEHFSNSSTSLELNVSNNQDKFQHQKELIQKRNLNFSLNEDEFNNLRQITSQLSKEPNYPKLTRSNTMNVLKRTNTANVLLRNTSLRKNVNEKKNDSRSESKDKDKKKKNKVKKVTQKMYKKEELTKAFEYMEKQKLKEQKKDEEKTKTNKYRKEYLKSKTKKKGKIPKEKKTSHKDINISKKTSQKELKIAKNYLKKKTSENEKKIQIKDIKEMKEKLKYVEPKVDTGIRRKQVKRIKPKPVKVKYDTKRDTCLKRLSLPNIDFKRKPKITLTKVEELTKKFQIKIPRKIPSLKIVPTIQNESKTLQSKFDINFNISKQCISILSRIQFDFGVKIPVKIFQKSTTSMYGRRKEQFKQIQKKFHNRKVLPIKNLKMDPKLDIARDNIILSPQKTKSISKSKNDSEKHIKRKIKIDIKDKKKLKLKKYTNNGTVKKNEPENNLSNEKKIVKEKNKERLKTRPKKTLKKLEYTNPKSTTNLKVKSFPRTNILETKEKLKNDTKTNEIKITKIKKAPEKKIKEIKNLNSGNKNSFFRYEEENISKDKEIILREIISNKSFPLERQEIIEINRYVYKGESSKNSSNNNIVSKQSIENPKKENNEKPQESINKTSLNNIESFDIVSFNPLNTFNRLSIEKKNEDKKEEESPTSEKKPTKLKSVDRRQKFEDSKKTGNSLTKLIKNKGQKEQNSNLQIKTMMNSSSLISKRVEHSKNSQNKTDLDLTESYFQELKIRPSNEYFRDPSVKEKRSASSFVKTNRTTNNSLRNFKNKISGKKPLFLKKLKKMTKSKRNTDQNALKKQNVGNILERSKISSSLRNNFIGSFNRKNDLKKFTKIKKNPTRELKSTRQKPQNEKVNKNEVIKEPITPAKIRRHISLPKNYKKQMNFGYKIPKLPIKRPKKKKKNLLHTKPKLNLNKINKFKYTENKTLFKKADDIMQNKKYTTRVSKKLQINEDKPETTKIFSGKNLEQSNLSYRLSQKKDNNIGGPKSFKALLTSFKKNKTSALYKGNKVKIIRRKI